MSHSVSRRWLLLTAVVVALTLSGGTPASAIITGFLPGDACFGSTLSGERLAQFDSDKPVIFPYRHGAGAYAGCGYSGYWTLSVSDMSEQVKANLKKLYQHLREFKPALVEVSNDAKGNELRRETNGFMILIYNKDYDLADGIGLKFNEAWMKLVEYRTEKLLRGAYWPYVTDYRAVARDWERATQNGTLRINEKDARPWWGPRVEEPVSIDADKIQILVLPEGLHPSFAWGSNSLPEEFEDIDDKVDNRHFYRVTSTGVSRCHYGAADELIVEPWPLGQRRRHAVQVEQLGKALGRASLETYGIDEDQLMPVDLRTKLDELRDDIDSLNEKLEAYSESLKQAPPTGESGR